MTDFTSIDLESLSSVNGGDGTGIGIDFGVNVGSGADAVSAHAGVNVQDWTNCVNGGLAAHMNAHDINTMCGPRPGSPPPSPAVPPSPVRTSPAATPNRPAAPAKKA